MVMWLVLGWLVAVLACCCVCETWHVGWFWVWSYLGLRHIAMHVVPPRSFNDDSDIQLGDIQLVYMLAFMLAYSLSSVCTVT